MKYHKERDRDARFQQMEINNSNPFFNAKIHLEYPSPAYKYELSDQELTKFGQRLQIEWSKIYNKMVENLLK